MISEKIQSQRKIADWLKETGWKISWDESNNDGYPTFHANTNSKPDILAQKNGYNILIEVKPCTKHSHLLDGIDQTIGYAGEYYAGRSKYYETSENNSEIRIDAFVLSTNYSKDGYLYQEESELKPLDDEYLVRQYDMTEKPITHTATRFLWRQWTKGPVNDFYNTIRAESKANGGKQVPHYRPKVGTLISKIKKSDRQITDEPFLFLNSNSFESMAGDRLYALD